MVVVVEVGSEPVGLVGLLRLVRGSEWDLGRVRLGGYDMGSYNGIRVRCECYERY